MKTTMRWLLGHRPRLLAAMALAAALPAAFLLVFGNHPLELAPPVHFGMVVSAAALAAVASAGLSIVGVRRSDGRTVLLSIAFSTMASLLLVHGLTTPSMLVGFNGVVAFAGGISLPAGAAILSFAALPALRRPRRVGRLLAAQLAIGVAIVALGAAGILAPSFVPGVPAAGSGAALALLVVGAVLWAGLAGRALRTFALTHRATDLMVAVGCVWCGVAQYPQLVSGYHMLGFYVGHMFEVMGIGLLAVPVMLDLVRGGASRPLVGDLSATEVVMAEEAYLGSRVRALLVSLEEKDRSTERHTRRVSLLAVRVGEQMRLPAASLRHLAMGGLLHDIGKLSVPESILGKPGSLTDEEFAEIKRHPDSGLRLLRNLGGFPEQVQRLVHEHHERLNGTGYPRGIAGPELGIGPRILAVCDVFDALTSDRCYRDAWTEEDALALLRREAGSAYDARVVRALEIVVGAQVADEKRATPPASDSETMPRSDSRSTWPSTSLNVK
jgi:putative nucleotidyltransferase with HDIG domain